MVSGITNALRIFCAALSDHKVLFHSRSYTRLTEASHAITAMMYPLKYRSVFNRETMDPEVLEARVPPLNMNYFIKKTKNSILGILKSLKYFIWRL